MRFKYTALAALLLVALVAATGCSKKQTPLSPVLERTGTTAQAVRHPLASPAAATHLEGEIGPGALYAIDVPEDWNGDLVLYAHGYSMPQEPVALPGGAYPGVRDQLLARHAAVAATSISENGFAEAEGVIQVHQLAGLFTSRVAAPRRIFLIGLSFGGLVGAELLHNFPAQYAGALTVSSPLGGAQAEFNYVGDVRLLWNLVMPWKLMGTFTDPPNRMFPSDSVVDCITHNQSLFGVVAMTHRQGGMRVAGRNGNELATSVVYTLGFHWYGMEDAVERAHGHMPYDNHDAVYVSDVVPAPTLAWINASIPRYTMTPDAVNLFRQHYEPDGVLRRPLLTLHTRYDPRVPWEHEQILNQRVTAAGSLDRLLQFDFNRFGHDEAFTSAEIGSAFDALVTWVDSGVKPPAPFLASQ